MVHVVIGLILVGYLFIRFLRPLVLSRPLKILLGILMVLGGFKAPLLHLLGGELYFAPDVPGWVLLVSGWLFCWVVLLFFFVLLSDAVRLLFFPILRRMGEQRALWGQRFRLTVLFLSFVAACAGVVEATRAPEIREVIVASPDLPRELDGMRLAVLGDIHADSLTDAERVREMVARTNAVRPDAVLLVGDFVDGRVAQRSQALLPLKEFRAPLGVFGVPGNHDYYSGYEEWLPFLRSLGIEMLLNEHKALAGDRLVVAGVTDRAAALRNFEMPDVKKALDGAPAGAYRILLAHQPAVAQELSEGQADLQISGHTHGGMMPVLDVLLRPFNGGFVAGYYHRDKRPDVLVTNGAGIWNGFPCRLGVPAEIVLLHLKRL